MYVPGKKYAEEIPITVTNLLARAGDIPNRIASLEVSEFDRIPDGMTTLTVPPQRYAVARHRNSSNFTIPQSYELLHYWIVEQGLTRIHRAWHLEISSSPDAVDLYDTLYVLTILRQFLQNERLEVLADRLQRNGVEVYDVIAL